MPVVGGRQRGQNIFLDPSGAGRRPGPRARPGRHPWKQVRGLGLGSLPYFLPGSRGRKWGRGGCWEQDFSFSEEGEASLRVASPGRCASGLRSQEAGPVGGQLLGGSLEGGLPAGGFPRASGKVVW